MGSVLQSSREGTFDGHVAEPGDLGGRGLTSRPVLPKPPSCWAGISSVPQGAATTSVRLPISLSLPSWGKGPSCDKGEGGGAGAFQPLNGRPQGKEAPSPSVLGRMSRGNTHLIFCLGSLEGLGTIVVHARRESHSRRHESPAP